MREEEGKRERERERERERGLDSIWENMSPCTHRLTAVKLSLTLVSNRESENTKTNPGTVLKMAAVYNFSPYFHNWRFVSALTIAQVDRRGKQTTRVDIGTQTTNSSVYYPVFGGVGERDMQADRQTERERERREEERAVASSTCIKAKYTYMYG